MQEIPLFNCCLIGEGNLLIECAEILLKQRHQIRVIVSPDQAVERWATSHKISFLKTPKQLLPILAASKCDYLFSIVNYSILPPQILNLVGKAINYHDALLPRYAGVNAAAWAIINGEDQHGITWHEMAVGIDTGHIIKQVAIDIEPTDIALSLNLKCYQAAIAGFTELIEELATDQVSLISQNLEERSYFSRYQKPEGLGILNFEQPATVINNLVRGLDFGNYPNPLTTPKLLLNAGENLDYVIVTQVQKLPTKSQRLPGTIIEIQDEQLIIATASQDIALQAMITQAGEAIAPGVLAQDYQLQPGEQLPRIPAQLSAEIVNLSQEVASGENYWCKQLLKGQSFVLPGRQKLKHQSTVRDFQRVDFSLSPTVIDSLQQTYGKSSLREITVAAWAVYLTRLSGNPQITLGFETRFKQCGKDRNLTRWFADYLPVNLAITPEQNLTAVLEAIARRTKLNQKYPTYARDLNLRDPRLGKKITNFALAIPQENLENYPQSDLILTIQPSNYCLYYDPEVFSCQQIEQMIEQWQAFVAGIASQDSLSLPVSQVSLLSTAAKKRLLEEWNQTKVDYPTDVCLHQLFEAKVVADPNAIAVVYEEKSLTRGELNRRANQLAHHLQYLGVQPETLVGICLERSLEMAIAVFAVLKAGGAYVPLDPNYPTARLNYLLEDAQVNVLLTQDKLLERLPTTSAKIVCLDQGWDQQNWPDTNPSSSVHSHNLAYIIYTSGSTGNPKGVAIEHHSAANTLFDIEERFRVQPQDRVLGVSSLSFDLSVYDIFGVLGSGGTMVIPQPSSFPDPEHWLELIAQKQITIWNSAPALLELMVNYLVGFGKQLPPSLRLILLSGDRINPNLVVQLQNFNPELQITSLGGATEASIWSIYYPITQKWLGEKTVPYGRPLNNQAFYILDSQLQLVPIGITGELYIGGIGLARGYFNRPELNASKFIANPFNPDVNARLYKTGDLGRYLEDGNIEFLGRIDNQVKIRGVRIELGEIEATLLQCPQIQETLVTVNRCNPHNPSLVAYSILKPNSTLTSQQLRDFLKTQLPESAIPATFSFLNSFPLTPNGKVDLKALTSDQIQQLETKLETANDLQLTSKDPLESQLIQIWSRILHVRLIAKDDNFFELGGDSLLALRLFEQIQKVFGQKLPLATLFAAPTIAQLAKVMHAQGFSPSWSALVSIQPKGTKPPFFCIHPVGGNVLTYYTLAAGMGTQRPFYGLQSKSLDGQQPTTTTIEEMAADYLQEIKLIQPQGPYHLGGHSFGGFVAYEMALQLEEKGEKVATLALLDCLGPNCPSKYPFNQQVKIHTNNLAQLSTIESLSYLRARIAGTLSKLVPLKVKEKYFELSTLFLSSQKKSLAILEQYNYKLVRKYRSNIDQAKVYGGNIVLFRAKVRTVEGYFAPSGGWEGLALGGIKVHDIPGDHLQVVLQPELHKILSRELNAADAKFIEHSHH